MTPMLTDPRLIVGLDLPSIDAARAMVERLGATVSRAAGGSIAAIKDSTFDTPQCPPVG